MTIQRPSSDTSESKIRNMCYREVLCTKHRCGHDIPHSECQVDCRSARCRYSAFHPSTCPACSSTCRQWLRPARTLVTQTSENFCFHCGGRKL